MNGGRTNAGGRRFGSGCVRVGRLVCAVLLLGSGAASSQQESSPQGPVSARGSAESQLRNLPQPDFAGVDPSVTEELLVLRRELSAVIDASIVAPASPSSEGVGPPELFAAVMEVGESYLAYQYAEAALAHFAAAVRLRPKAPRALYLLGFSYQETGEVDAASEAFDRLITLAPDYAPAQLRFGRLALEQGQLALAKERFRAALRSDSACAAAHYGLGLEALERGAVSDAVSLFGRSLDLDPSLTQPRYALGMALRDLGDLEAASRELSRVAEAPALSTATWQGCADPILEQVRQRAGGSSVHLMRATLARQRGDSDLEIAEFELAIKADPGSVLARRGLAARFVEDDFLDRALSELEAVVRLEPDNAESRFDLGEVQRVLGRLAEAEQNYLQALEISPTLLPALRQLGGLYFAQKRFPEAAQIYRRALEVQVAAKGGPEVASEPPAARDDLRIPLAISLMQSGDRQGAVHQLDRALVDREGSVSADHLRLVEMLLLFGGVDQALKRLEPYLAVPVDGQLRARAHMWIGSVALGRSQAELGRQHLRIALEIDPSLEQARRMLADGP